MEMVGPAFSDLQKPFDTYTDSFMDYHYGRYMICDRVRLHMKFHKGLSQGLFCSLFISEDSMHFWHFS